MFKKKLLLMVVLGIMGSAYGYRVGDWDNFNALAGNPKWLEGRSNVKFTYSDLQGLTSESFSKTSQNCQGTCVTFDNIDFYGSSFGDTKFYGLTFKNCNFGPIPRNNGDYKKDMKVEYGVALSTNFLPTSYGGWGRYNNITVSKPSVPTEPGTYYPYPYRSDFHETIFENCNMQKVLANFEANFNGAQFINGTNLTGADFSGAKFLEHNGKNTSFVRSVLANTTFNGAVFGAANFKGLTIGKGTSFQGATLTGTNFEDTVMNFVNFSSSSSQKTEINGVSFSGSHFESVSFNGAQIDTMTNFGETKGLVDGGTIPGARLDHVDFTNVTFVAAEDAYGNMSNAINFRGVKLFNPVGLKDGNVKLDFTGATYLYIKDNNTPPACYEYNNGWKIDKTNASCSWHESIAAHQGAGFPSF
jgi:uncharacterized protein YjbI with pentapeptide repeats